MKWIKYTMHSRINRGTEQEPRWEDVLTPAQMSWSEANEICAKQEAYNGAYTVYDDGASAQPSQLDVLEAQLAYTAMMTDTLLEV